MEFKSKKLIEQLNTSAKRKGRGEIDPATGQPYELHKRKMTISGIIVGLVTGIPLGLFIELWRFLTSQPWDDFFIGIVICLITLVLSTAAGYFYGIYLDGGS